MFLIGKQIINNYYANPYEQFVIDTLRTPSLNQLL